MLFSISTLAERRIARQIRIISLRPQPKANNMNVDALVILDNIDQYIFCKNSRKEYIYVNQPLMNLFDVKCKNSIIGKTDFDIKKNTHPKEIERYDDEVLSGKTYTKREMTLIINKKTLKIIISKKPLLSENGHIIGIICNFFEYKDKLILEEKGNFDIEKRRLHLGFTPESLSYSEVNICFYLIQGFSVKKISEKIDISESTVRYHIDNIKNKMQCSHKNEIVEVAMKTGIAWKIISLQHTANPDSEK